MLVALHNWIKRRKEAIVIFGSIVGVGYAVFEYRNAVQAERVKRTIDLFDEFRDKEVSRDNYISRFFDKNHETLKLNVTDESGYGHNLFSMIYTLNKKDHETINIIMESAYFYSSVSVCSINHICDYELSCKVFSRQMRNFYSNLKGFFELYEKEKKDSISLEILAFLNSNECRDDLLSRPF